jgi:predicted Zn-dependent protease
MAVRVALVLTALLVAAWLAVLMRDSLLVSHAQSRSLAVGVRLGLYHAESDLAEARSLLADLRRGRFLNPARSGDAFAALLLGAVGERGRATDELEAFTRAYPRDPLGWATYANVASLFDTRRAARARARLRLLDPLGQ